MRTEIVEHKIYAFDELDESAKERARQWFRESSQGDEWWEYVYEDAATIAEMLGIELRNYPVKLIGGGTRYGPAIYFSGFSSQGDGACFEGSYSYRKGSVRAVKAHAPNDEKLHTIAERLQAEQRKAFYGLTATIVHRGYYNHSGCMDIDVERQDNGEFDASEIESCLRAFADWIYRQLENEHDYQNSDEVVDDNIRANEYEFDENGNRV